MASPKILLTEDTSSVQIKPKGRTLTVHHKAYVPPNIKDAEVMEFGKFKTGCRKHIAGFDSLVFVGLNKAMTPGNRTEDVWELLFNQTRELNRVSVDNTIFVSEPWRAWFHFGLVGATYRNYTYSYIAESQYKSYMDGMRDDDPFSLEEMLRWGKGVVRSDHARWFDDLAVRILTISVAAHAEYAEAKRAAFEEEVAINSIIARLETFASNACPFRSLMAPHELFRTRKPAVVATDLPIDRWLTAQLRRLVGLVNGVAKEFYQ